MPTHARRLPDLEDTPLVTDGGLETDLIFNRGFDLPHFAACVLLDRADGVAALREYFRVRRDRPPPRGGGAPRDAHLAGGARLGRAAGALTRGAGRDEPAGGRPARRHP